MHFFMGIGWRSLHASSFGFSNSGKYVNPVCKLQKSLYGLKQTSWQWYAMFSHALLDKGFTHCQSDNSLFVRCQGGVFMVFKYVDNIILACNDLVSMNAFKTSLVNHFKLKDKDDLKFFLGLETARSAKRVSLCQRLYAL